MTGAATRTAEIDPFLDAAGWGDAARSPIAGDASARSYIRLAQGGQTSVLMDAPPDREATAPFVRVARHLSGIGLSAPEIYAWDKATGLLLLEDFGAISVTEASAADPSDETHLYAQCGRLLGHLHKASLPDWLAPYGPAEMAAALDPFFAWAAPDSIDADAVRTTLHTLLEKHTPETDVMILRDFHSDNLMWLQDRSGIAEIGLLDFQDALAGHASYDMASLLQDARRDVSAKARTSAITAFCEVTDWNEDRLEAAMALQGAQRNLRILGLFAKFHAQGRTRYQALVPRVRAHTVACLRHPVCVPLAALLAPAFPELEAQP
ncbi:aminoglycoside phosphotransferase family protein [Pseudaestuariivita sp.]|uniref:aminoglycoside phosphotransferase family protein n=1 Tax=Pseudaestuariivita sp. TaxID=2211669 RepID=UPI004059AFC9